MYLDEGIDKYLEYDKAMLKSVSTIRHHSRILDQFNEYLTDIRNRPVELQEITTEDIERFIFHQYNLTKYSTSTIHNAISAISAFFTYMANKRKCNNVCKGVRNVKVETPERSIISEIEFKRILHNIQIPAVKAVLCTQYYAGLRIGEAVSLTLEDVDLVKDEIHVTDTKNKEDRTVPISDRLKKFLQEYVSNGRTDCGTRKFFSTYPKGQICAQYVNKRLKEAVVKTGITKALSSHNLRHSFASTLLRAGVDLVTLKKLMGHKKVRTTMVYLHTDLKQLEEAVNVL